MHMNKTYNHKTKIERIRSIVVYGIFIFRKHYRKLKNIINSTRLDVMMIMASHIIIIIMLLFTHYLLLRISVWYRIEYQVTRDL